MSGAEKQRRLRVAFVSQGLGRIVPPKAHGSIATWTYETARRMTSEHEVLLLEFGEQALATVREQHEGMACVYLPAALNRVVNAMHRRVSALWEKLWPAARRLQRPPYTSIFHNLGFTLLASIEARRRRCDVIHIHNFSQFVSVMRWLNPSARIVLHMNCEWLSQHDAAMIRRRIDAADGIICCSGHIARKVLARFPDIGPKVHVVLNGADVERFVPALESVTAEPPAPLRILFVGRISPEKGVHLLAEAFAIVGERFPTARLELVGGAGALPAEFLVALSDDPNVQGLTAFYGRDYLEEVKTRIPPHLRDRVVFHGNRNHAELAAHLREATVFCNSSLSDAFPLTVVEAMAAGLPIVASAVGGVPEAVAHEKTGVLVEANSAEALASGLCRLLGDSAMRRRMALAARERALSLFSWNVIARSVSGVYDQLWNA